MADSIRRDPRGSDRIVSPRSYPPGYWNNIAMSRKLPLEKRQSIIVAICRSLATGKDRMHTAEYIRNARRQGWWWADLTREVAEQVLLALDTNQKKKEALRAFVDILLTGPDYTPELAFGRAKEEIMGYL